MIRAKAFEPPPFSFVLICKPSIRKYRKSELETQQERV